MNRIRPSIRRCLLGRKAEGREKYCWMYKKTKGGGCLWQLPRGRGGEGVAFRGGKGADLRNQWGKERK